MGLKPSKKKVVKAGRSAKEAGPGLLARGWGRLGVVLGGAIGGAVAGGRVGISAITTHVQRAFLGVLVVGAGIGWIVGREPLREAVAEMRARTPGVVFLWPRSSSGDRGSETWMPPALRSDLVRTAGDGLSADPFDQPALELAREKLIGTGWFERIDSVRRGPGGEVEVDGKWRVPVAVVRQEGRDLLVASRGEILRLPEGLPVSPGSMPIIFGPYALAPRNQAGEVRFGEPWPGGDVQDAIRLIGLLRSRPGYERIVGVELADYMKTGRLTLVADTGARFVWGSTLGRSAPGEAPTERRLANLKNILDEHRDAPGFQYEIYTPYVLVDTKLARD